MFRGAWKRFALAVVIVLAAVVPTGAVAASAAPNSRVVAVASLESGVLSEMNKNIACTIAKAESELGYNPKVALEEGMRRSLASCIQQGNQI